MTVRDVITLAQSGELFQLSPTIRDNDNTIVAFINLGLIEIYKRFSILTDEAIITLKDGKTIYKMDGSDTTTVTLGNATIPCVALGTHRYMNMIAAYEVNGFSTEYDQGVTLLPINEEDDKYSINTISYNEIQIPLIMQEDQISIMYNAFPPKIVAGTTGWDTKEVPLPDQFIECLLHYIGYRGHGAMNGDTQNDSNTHYMRFEASCNMVKMLGVGVTPDDIEMRTRVYNRCFA